MQSEVRYAGIGSTYHTVKERQTGPCSPATTAWQPKANVPTNLWRIHDENILIIGSDIIGGDDVDWNKRIILCGQAEKRHCNGVAKLMYVCRIVIVVVNIAVSFAGQSDASIDLCHSIGLQPPPKGAA